MRTFKNGIDIKWLAVLFIGLVLGTGITSAAITIGDPDSTFNILHGEGGNISNLSAAQIVGNFTQQVNFSNIIRFTGLTATVPNDYAICYDPVTTQTTVNTGITDCSASSETVKENIQTLKQEDIAPEKFNALHPVKFNYKTDPQKKEKIGLLAEELVSTYPEAVGYGENGEIRGINYNMLIPVLISKAQEQHNTIITQQNDINMLKYEIELLKGNNATAPTPIPTSTPTSSGFWAWLTGG